MSKKSYSITVDEDVVSAFRKKCKEQDVNQSMLVGAFMKSYVEERVKLDLVNKQNENNKNCRHSQIYF